MAELDGPVCDVEGHARTAAWRLEDGPWVCGKCEAPPVLSWGAFVGPVPEAGPDEPESATHDEHGACERGPGEHQADDSAAEDPWAAAASHDGLARRAAQLWRPAAVSQSGRDELARTVPAFMARSGTAWPEVAALVAEAATRPDRTEADLLAIFATGTGA